VKVVRGFLHMGISGKMATSRFDVGDRN
jgi:hypothetical protein